MNDSLLIVFVKNPVPGEVKHRLAKHLGDEAAAKIYRQLAEAVLQKTAPANEEDYSIEICFAPTDAAEHIRAWLKNCVRFSAQQGDHLGERMFNAFKRAFDSGYKKVALIGSDCPDISRDIIIQSFALLQKKQVVLGPAYDGGYYLIGLRQPRGNIFQNIEWGTEKVFQQTCDKIKAAGLAFALLQTLRDVDRVEDLQYYNFL